MEVTEGLYITIEFTLTDPSGKVIETTQGGEPISFKFGSRSILPGLANAIAGMKVGEEKSGKIPAGQLIPRELCGKRRVPRAELPAGASPKVGDRFSAKESGHAHPVQLEVVATEGDAIEVLLLHPLHGVEIAYDVKVVSARRPNVPPPAPVSIDEDLTDAVLEEEV